MILTAIYSLKRNMEHIQHSKPSVGEEEQEAIQKVMESKQLGFGEEVEAFEDELADFLGVNHVIATNTGTGALHLALKSLKVDSEERVILPSYACSALLHAIHYRDAVPRPVDVDADSFAIDPYQVRGSLEPETKAVIAPHMFGLPAPVDEILDLGIPVIEDCSMTIGTEFRGNKVGSIADVSIGSFYATKLLCSGSGGFLATDDDEIYTRANDLVNHDEREEYKVRLNYRMNNMQAAVGRVQLNKIDDFIERRRELAKNYLSTLQEAPVGLPSDPTEGNHIYYRFVIESGPMDRHVMENFFEEKDIEIKGPVYKPLHRYVNLSDEEFPNTTSAFRQNVSLPIYPDLTNEEQQKVIETLFEFAENQGVL